MSKYIDMLHLIVEGNNRGDFFISNELLKEANAILAQPESKQEPVAWMYDHHIEVGHDKYTEFNVVETCARNLEFESCINVRPLYLAPPKREPFGPEERQRLSKAYSTKAEQVAFEEGIIFAEISYGIGGGE